MNAIEAAVDLAARLVAENDELARIIHCPVTYYFGEEHRGPGLELWRLQDSFNRRRLELQVGKLSSRDHSSFTRPLTVGEVENLARWIVTTEHHLYRRSKGRRLPNGKILEGEGDE